MEVEVVTVVGNVGQDPRRKVTPKGEVLEFSVAHNHRVKAPDGSIVDGETTWYRVSVWGRLGANAAASLKKGQPVIVHGELTRPEWIGQDGAARHGLDIKASAVGHDLNNGVADFTRGVRVHAPVERAAPAPAPEHVAVGAAPAGAWAPPPGTDPAVAPPAPAGWSTNLAPDEDAPF